MIFVLLGLLILFAVGSHMWGKKLDKQNRARYGDDLVNAIEDKIKRCLW